MIERTDPQWYRDAIIYQVHVKSFFDANDDGIGEFEGLTSKLDYIKELGVTAIWVMPFYPSPLRDDGYDIADYRDINPAYGTMRDFRRFVKAAHERGLRIITELVINHTSDQHPWFQRARAAKPGSAARDFYVWSDTDKRYEDTRIIFLDTETSNWTWDPVAQSYFWHRFYSHQPDLNFDNPRVLEAVLDTMRFWLDMGVDGLRLDAIPYLVEREGTNCENLPETHSVIKKIRAALDEAYPDRMLLAEANQWPEETAPYFGAGDECHMAFHFPLMPRMYMAIAQEDRHPITDIMRQTPEIPENCQWAIFLRNHDELTLEMVTDKERDYLWTFYAADRRARINLGIRRRLAPLLENDRRKVELLMGLLFSMPGTPVLYYGDEIGMGDNIYLGDRDGVRTPMQWSPDRNGGFSRSDPARLFLPVLQDAIYGFAGLNVEAQIRSPSSLLNWTRRMIAVRKNHQAFGRGTLRFFYPANRKVLAYAREFEDDRIVCAFNLSRAPQAVQLDLSEFKGLTPREMSGGTLFPPIGELPYLLTLPAFGFYMFELVAAPIEDARFGPRPAPELFTLVLTGGDDSIFQGRELTAFERTAAPRFVGAQRWFAGKGRIIESAKLGDVAVMESTRRRAVLLTQVEVKLAGGETQRYFLPLSMGEVTDEEQLLPYALSRVRRGREIGLLYDGAFDPRFALDLVARMQRGDRIGTTRGNSIRFSATARMKEIERPEGETARRLGTEQSNTTLLIGESIIVKVYRRLQAGIHPEVEVARFLTEVAGFANTPPLLGTVEMESEDGTTTALGIAQAFVRNQGDAWTFALELLKRELETIALVPEDQAPAAMEAFEGYLRYARILGQRTAELHRAFAIPTDDPAFGLEPLTANDVATAVADARAMAERAFAALGRLPAGGVAPEVETLRAQRDTCFAAIDAFAIEPVGAVKTRIHGDYHLGQVLVVQKDVTIVDFEGEPTRSTEERRAKASPLRDVAGMLRSFAYVAEAAYREVTGRLPERAERTRAAAYAWERMAARAFLESYDEAAVGSEIHVADQATRSALLRLHLLTKALYEVDYEASNRPDWIGIPALGVLSILSEGAAA